MNGGIRQIDDERIVVEAGTARVLAGASCPHRGGRLRYARLNARTMRLTCPLHQATFDLATGERTAGPACAALRVSPLPGDEREPR